MGNPRSTPGVPSQGTPLIPPRFQFWVSSWDSRRIGHFGRTCEMGGRAMPPVGQAHQQKIRAEVRELKLTGALSLISHAGIPFAGL